MSHEVPPYSSTRLTAQLGMLLTVMLALMFSSGAFFYLYAFNYDLPPGFTWVRFFHFYTGLASIPILLAKYGTTFFRFGGYYLRVPRYKAAGPPQLIPRILSPLLAADFFVLYFSGLYMLFHYYYTVTNIWPFDAKPVQVHLWAAIIGAPLVSIHLLWHLASAWRSVAATAQTAETVTKYAETPRGVMSRRTMLAGIGATGLTLALAFQNTKARSWEFANLFIGRIPESERGGPGNFPVETLFGRQDPVDTANYRLVIEGEVDERLELTYEELLALPSVEHKIRISCVSGWTEVPAWRGPKVRDVLALAKERANTGSVAFHSLSGYGLTWHRRRLDDDKALLATHVNGAPLSTYHGYPVRLIVPGYPGQNMVKQIDRIFVRGDKEEFHVDFQIVSNPGQLEDRA
ncbi:MAG: molybdopterin-dependent oxidoreductase [Dehalococcoidia bacterium]